MFIFFLFYENRDTIRWGKKKVLFGQDWTITIGTLMSTEVNGNESSFRRKLGNNCDKCEIGVEVFFPFLSFNNAPRLEYLGERDLIHAMCTRKKFLAKEFYRGSAEKKLSRSHFAKADESSQIHTLATTAATRKYIYVFCCNSQCASSRMHNAKIRQILSAATLGSSLNDANISTWIFTPAPAPQCAYISVCRCRTCSLRKIDNVN